eukprot:gene28679-biopygen32588
MRETVQKQTNKIANIEATLNAQRDTIVSQEKRISALEAAIKDRPVVPPAGGKESAWSRPLIQRPGSAPPDQAGYDMQFRISGIPEDPNENDRQLAVAVKSKLTQALEANNTYAQKEQDKAEFTIVSAQRMGGKVDPSRPRLALITVSSSFDASSIVRNRRFLKDSGIAALDFLSPEELKLHKEHLPAFLEAKRDPSKWVSFNRGLLKVRDKAPPSGKIIGNFQEKGNVVVMGDFNARVGLGVDNDDTELGDEPVSQTSSTAPNQTIQPRCSMDTAPPNRLGGALLQLCVVTGLIILNGRTEGDMQGAHTFFADGMDKKSVIDYALAAPSLLNTPGVKFSVAPKHDCPLRPGGGKFDHMPITLNIPDAALRPSQGTISTPAGGKPSPKLKWKDNYVQMYAHTIKRDPDVNRLLDNALHSSSMEDSEKGIASAIELAISKCTPCHKPVAKRKHGPVNAWYDDECNRARQAASQAEHQHGSSSDLAGSMHKEYKRILRRKKRKWLETRMENLHTNLRHNPKSFWKDVREPNKATTADITIHDWTDYFADLFDVQVGIDPSLDARDFVPQADGPQIEAAPTWLCQDFTTQEVFSVLQSLRKNSSPGVDGIPAEWYRFASHEANSRFVQAMTNLFNLIWKTSYPSQWAAAALVPVPKSKGSVYDKDNYRGLAVSNSIGKIFSLCMLRRLDDWSEEFNLRAAGQYGFRSGRGTADASFILNHIVDKYREKKKPLFVAFVDFKKAYDWVNRDLLWDCLARLGVKDPYLSILKSMYNHVVFQVRLHGDIGSSFPSLVGVKQGDPLSPLLFGLFIDRIESFLQSKLPNVGAELRGKILQLLLYADDLAIMAESPADMQAMLDCLRDFCEATKMAVNIKKTEIVVFNKQFCDEARMDPDYKFVYDGAQLSTKIQ